MYTDEKRLKKCVQAEMHAWSNLAPGVVLAILFCFIHRLQTGESIEETFRLKDPEPDYQI